MNKKLEEKRLVFASYVKLLEGARHHAGLQSKYRIMASTWLLASFAGIGFLLSSNQWLPFDHLLGVGITCGLGIIGLYLTWYEDTYVQELLLDMNVVEALEAEKKHVWLPQIHHCFLNIYQTTNAGYAKILYFVGCKTILFIIGTVALGVYAFQHQSLKSTICIITGCLLLNFSSTILMLKKASKIQKFIRFLSNVDERSR